MDFMTTANNITPTEKQEEEESKKQKELETQMAAMKINTDYKPKYGQDPALFNQMYMDYI